MTFTIDSMRRQDWKQVKEIYREGLATGLAAFMLEPPIWKYWDMEHLKIGRLVARARNDEIAGWAALTIVPNT